MILKRNLDIFPENKRPKKKEPIIDNVDTMQLFESMFKVGDWVTLITDEDRIHQGKLVGYTEDGCSLRQFMARKWVNWGEVMFICHDGFPTKKLHPSGADEFIDLLLKTKVTREKQDLIRRSLVNSACLDCGQLADNDHLYYAGRCRHCKKKHTSCRSYNRSFSHGDPFIVENVECRLFNPGNNSLYYQAHNDTFIETLAMKAADGAMAQLYTLNTITDWEVVT